MEGNPPKISELLSSLVQRAKGEKITVGDMLDPVRSRAHGLGLFLFALPEALPLPVAGVSAILAIPLVLISGHLVIFGSQRGLPPGILRRKMPSRLLRMAVAKAIPILERIEKISRPRWLAWTSMERVLGLFCLALAIIIALPIPFGNLPPAVCLATIAFGMLQRDGLLVAAGLIGSILLFGGLVALGDFLLQLYHRVTG
ncbi:exopolysaccharide biosynthesis protein [Rhodoligotrophos defluvii]|uniref:exopolysaccharide biosynthesis protein n=1 Tax=Rhodoligotrophos defluvii TaxID=2561934 RepID=UPI0010C95FC0|nr:exopolysaccharide biosynthesis protein [Rhodoligotrophos defluvii]